MNDITIVFKDSYPLWISKLPGNRITDYYHHLACGLAKEYGYDIKMRKYFVPNSTIVYWELEGPRQKLKRLLQNIDWENNKINNKEIRLGPDLWFEGHNIFNYYNMNEFDKLSDNDLYNKYRELAYMFHDHIRDAQRQAEYLNSKKKKPFWRYLLFDFLD